MTKLTAPGHCHGPNDPSEFVDLEIETGYKWMHLIAYKARAYIQIESQYPMGHSFCEVKFICRLI